MTVLAAVVAISILLAAPTPALAHQWRRVHGTYVLAVADADAHLWRLRLRLERTRSGTAEIAARCAVEIARATLTRTITIPRGEPSVNVAFGYLVRFSDRHPPDPHAVRTGEADHCHRV